MTKYLQQKTWFRPSVYGNPTPNLGLCIIIPVSYSPYIFRTLFQLKTQLKLSISIEIIVVFYNHKENNAKTNLKVSDLFLKILKWSKINSKPELKFSPIFYDNIPSSYATMDTAIKCGADEALYRFLKKGKRSHGFILIIPAYIKLKQGFSHMLNQRLKNRLSRKRLTPLAWDIPTEGIDYSELEYQLIPKILNAWKNMVASKRKFPEHYHSINLSRLWSKGTLVSTHHYQVLGGWMGAINTDYHFSNHTNTYSILECIDGFDYKPYVCWNKVSLTCFKYCPPHSFKMK